MEDPQALQAQPARRPAAPGERYCLTPHRMESCQVHAGLEKGLAVRSRQLPRSRSIHDQPHRDAGQRTLAERVVEALAGRVALEDVRLEQHLASGAEDGREHGWIRLGAVHQDRQPVPGLHPVRSEAVSLAGGGPVRRLRLQGLRVLHRRRDS